MLQHDWFIQTTMVQYMYVHVYIVESPNNGHIEIFQLSLVEKVVHISEVNLHTKCPIGAFQSVHYQRLSLSRYQRFYCICVHVHTYMYESACMYVHVQCVMHMSSCDQHRLILNYFVRYIYPPEPLIIYL